MSKNAIAKIIMNERKRAKETNDKVFDIHTKLMLKTLHEEFKFGPERLKRFADAYNKSMASFVDDSDNTENADYAMYALNRDILAYIKK